jgi:RNA polymerase sigma factor (sigma-70 family)
MRDTQTLLAEYVRNGSEAAFRKLVEAYVGLVYSTALRLVGGNTHRAEDVAQTVFVDLARKARTLPKDTMLGGWLHRDTCFVASKLLRSERRRQFRERQAAEMNALDKLPDQALAEIAPVLDEAINELGSLDRTAILLRFFERLDLARVGREIGISENAAQKRLSRALEKLHHLLKRRGITLSAGALATALSAQAVTAAPAGLAAGLAGVALASAAPVTGLTLTLLKVLNMTTIQKTLTAIVVVTAVSGGIYGTREVSRLRTQLHASEQARATSEEKSETLARERDAALSQIAALRDQNQQLSRDRTEQAAVARQQSAAATVTSQPPLSTGTAVASVATNDLTADEALGRELAEAILRREPKAIENLLNVVKKAHATFARSKAGLTNAALAELSMRTFAAQNIAMRVIEEAALNSNPNAFDAINEMAPIPELQAQVMGVLGKLAGKGNADALEILLDPQQSGFTNAALGSIVSSLGPAAGNGDQRAIDALVAVTTNQQQRGLWFLAADGLNKAAENGNPAAVDALINLAPSATNQSVRNAVVDGLRKAAANQNRKAIDALVAMGVQ